MICCMVMTPRTLGEWDVSAITDILSKGLFETEDFDFKTMLPDSRDSTGKTRLRGACVAFANSNGGFLVFGVSDDRSAAPVKRLVGLDPVLDFPAQFGDYPKICVPSVDWSFRNPAIVLPSSRVIHVVQIPKSWKAPHAVGSPDEGWRFLKRTNKGDEGMNMDEVRAAFLAFYEKRLRLQLLRGELAGLREAALGARITDPNRMETHYSLVTFDTTVIASILADTYPLTVSSPQLLEALARLRHEVMIANNKTKLFFSVVELPMSGKNVVIRRQNEFMGPKCGGIAALCETAIQALDEILKP